MHAACTLHAPAVDTPRKRAEPPSLDNLKLRCMMAPGETDRHYAIIGPRRQTDTWNLNRRKPVMAEFSTTSDVTKPQQGDKRQPL